MTTELQRAFPSRPLRITETGVASSWLTHLISLACLAGGIAFGVWQAPELIRDNEIRQNFVVAQDGRVSNGKCRTRKAVFTTCEADIAYAVDGRRYTHHSDIFFVDLNTEGYSSAVVRSATKPELGTMSIAIDYFWDRVATVAGISGILVLIGVFGFLAGIRAGRMKRLATAAALPLALAPVQVVNWSESKGRLTFQFKAEAAGKLRDFKTTFGKDEQPFQTADGQLVAVVPEGTAAAILLDAELKRVDLTDDERARLREAAAATGHAEETPAPSGRPGEALA